MQLRHETGLTSRQYVTEEGWRQARLKSCPFHPGGCSLRRHGTYERVDPPGMRVARAYCQLAQTTISLLPDCLAVRLPGSLDEIEQTIVAVERARSVEAATEVVRPDIQLPGAVRWVRRRRAGVRAALIALLTLMPGQLGSEASVRALRRVLSTERALVALRGIGAAHLPNLPRPLGFRAPSPRRAERERSPQHETGPDPPPT